MSHRIFRRTATLASLAACLGASPAHAAVPETPPEELAKSAAPDTSRFLPRWLHAHAAIGLGWIASPLAIRQLYQAGQGYEAGLEVRPSSGWRVRLNGEYQTLPIVTEAHLVVTIPPSFPKGEPVQDTLHLEGRGNGWLGSGRLEVQKALIPGIWALGGLGGGYLSSGLDVVNGGIVAFSLANAFPGTSGWVLMPTLGGIAESDILGPMLGIEVRWTGVMKSSEHLQTWIIRIGWQGF